MASPPPDLTRLLATLDPEAPLAGRHLWLIDLVQWLRGDGANVSAAAARLRLLLDATLAHPEEGQRWRRWWQAFLATVDATPLLADHGFAPRSAFFSEFGHRLRRKLLPGTPETSDLGELFDLLRPTAYDAQWLRALDADTLARLHRLLLAAAPADAPADAPEPGSRLLMDALTYSVSQVSATGFASEIRIRMSDAAKQARPFHDLPAHFEALRAAVATHGAQSAPALVAAGVLREQLDACRHAAYTVYAHLDAHGVSVGIVFRLRQLRERIIRIKALLDCLSSDQPAQAMTELLAQLAQISEDRRSLRALITTSSHLTAAKVAERSAESGEHYITRDAAEYRAMLGAAAGGGAVLAFTTWAKFAIYALGLSAFWSGLAAGLNYAASFVLIMLMHWTVATKQPAMTASAMAAKLKDMGDAGAVESFVDEVANLLRSQIAAILGNLGLVVPVVLLICWALRLAGLPPMVDLAHTRKVLHEQHLLGPTALFAAFTGVLLFASSIIAGWVENWFVFHRLDSAIAHHPRCARLLGGTARAQRWSGFLRRHISGFSANISLGLMLGLVPAFTAFFGLGLEVRHVTLSTGQVAAAAATLGQAAWQLPDFWWALAGIAVIGPLNLAVSFYLAFRLALAAHSVTRVDRRRIHAALRRRLLQAPASFLLPPRHRAEAGAAGPQ
ncbi:site-specific recombinase [Ramlibacter sp. 2FC]|uniref:site-specific recombinase n=1 Tax=Ramlibacter sp. 2FC TaxID=2502188 RepID=UPI0010F6DD54|nr:site-specific recombinase [Ramlibacter sp. 2FC]